MLEKVRFFFNSLTLLACIYGLVKFGFDEGISVSYLVACICCLQLIIRDIQDIFD